ncbi:hypothetical protein J4219_02150 [Candidatus Woesearchaeota archaeon]|nr:hypothetical protein [Candidatus Woesearchaeota archaeon]
MDEWYRSVERESGIGDPLATRRLATLERRRGMPNRVLERLSSALLQDPQNEDLQKEYRAAGGFWIERTRDEILGDSFIYINMEFNGQKVTFARKSEPIMHGWLSRDKQCHSLQTTAEFEYATRLQLLEYKNHPALAQTISEALTTHKLEFLPPTGIILADVFSLDGALHFEESKLFGRSGQRVLAYPLQHAPGNCHFLLCDCPDHNTGDTPPAYIAEFLRGLLGERYAQGLAASREILKKPGRHIPITLTMPSLEEITDDNFQLVARKGMTELRIEKPHTLQNMFKLAYKLIRPINPI